MALETTLVEDNSQIDNNLIEKDLIKNNIEFSIFNNPEATTAIKNFIKCPWLNKIIVNCNSSLLMDFSFSNLKEIAPNSLIFNYSSAEIDDIIKTIRKSSKLTFKINKHCLEGEIIKMIPTKPFADGTPSGIFELTLMSGKETREIKVNSSFLNKKDFKEANLSIQNVLSVGDIVYIEPTMGILRRLGRSERKLNEFDLEGNRYVPLSKAPVYSVKEKEYKVSFDDLDKGFFGENFDRNNCGELDDIIKNYIDKKKCVISESIIILKNAEILSKFDILKIEQICKKYSFYKFILIGDFDKENSIYDDFLKIKINNDFVPIEYLRVLSNKINDEKYFNIAIKYVNRDNYEIVSEMLNLSKNTEEFQQFLINQFGNK